MKSREMMTREWVGPRCSRPGINRSMSDMTEATNNRGILTLTFTSLDVIFPVMYPKARCPTANVCFPSLSMRFYNLFENSKLNVLFLRGCIKSILEVETRFRVRGYESMLTILMRFCYFVIYGFADIKISFIILKF